MRFAKHLFFSVIVVLTVLACGLGSDLSTSSPADLPVETWIPLPSVIPRQPRTPSPLPLPVLPTRFATATIPAWVADFSDPILAAVEGQRTIFEDDFSVVCIDKIKKWKVCSTLESNENDGSSVSGSKLVTTSPTLDIELDLQNSYTLLNKGWFYIVPGSSIEPYYANIQDGSLLLKLPAENEKRDYWVYNPGILRRNFLLSFELWFLGSQPEDTFRFQFDQTAEQGVAFDLSKNQNWALHWGSFANWQSRTGIYTNFPPEPISVLVIAKGKECAVYLDNAPLAYLEDCRTGPVVRPSPWAMTFHVLAEPGHVASAAIDNLKLWDLDKIPGLSH